MFPEHPPPIASTSPSRRLIFPIPSPHLPPHVTSTSPSRRLHFPLPSPPLPPPFASTPPSRRLHFPLPSPPLPPPVASTSPSRRLHFPLPSPPLPPPVASTSPSRRLHFPLPSHPLPHPIASTSPSRPLHFPFPSPSLPAHSLPSFVKLPDYLTGGLLTLATLLCLCCSSDGLTPTSPLLTPSSSPLSCIGACVLFCLWMLWAAEEELYGEKILSVDSLTSDFYSMLSSHLSILPSLRSLTLSPSTSPPFSVCCALTSSATPGSMRCGWWEA
ncbi:unnamed protein product [Closterium sp. Naga37s-1]|nr:unnamed protein product [Closterium sp. Naga37s-1]